MTVQDWITVTGHSSNDSVRNIHFALKHGLSTGRLPNWTLIGFDKFFTKNGKVMTNQQQRNAIVTAIMKQKENTTSSGVKALQFAFGITVR